MPTFGIVTSVDNAAAVRAAGWDFVEELAQNFFQAHVPDGEWKGPERLSRSVLPVPAANALLPASLKVVGPEADPDRLRDYAATVIRRASQVGTEILVFGSGAARTVPDGFDRGRARRQILDFVTTAAGLAARHGVTIVAEPLNRGECNIINSVAEAMEYVKEIGHPNFQCLVDSFHFWLEDEPLEDLRRAMPFIRHVHLADTENRVAPGESGRHDYRPLFRVLKDGGYDGRVAIEPAGFTDIAGAGPRVLEFLKRQWGEA